VKAGGQHSPTDTRSSFDLEGAYNFRDLGGLPTDDGRRTRRGVVFRSDTLNELTEADAGLACETLGISCVIDLRTPEEVAAEGRGPLVDCGVSYVNLPVYVPVFEHDGGDAWPGGELLVSRYFGYLELSADNVVAALDVLSRSATSPTVFHCTSGKDRTGVVAALLLRLLGVTEEAVVEDYSGSASSVPRLLERLARSPHYQMDPVLPREIYQAERSTMRVFLAELETRFGGAAAWAQARGLTPETILRLERSLLEPPPSEKG
jgi:protein-tyrosine phosphatase